MNSVVSIGREQDPAKRIRKAWGDNIAQLRALRAMSRAALANKVGVTEAAVGMWERGETAPRPHIQIAIANALDCDHGVVFPMRAA